MTSETEDRALRYRRAKSATRAEEITEKQKKVRKSQLDRPTLFIILHISFLCTHEERYESGGSSRSVQGSWKVEIRCHQPRDSLFSWSSEFTNFTGLVNWGFLMLSIGGLRLCLENLIKYGVRVNPIDWIVVLTGYNEGGGRYPSLILICFLAVPALTCLLLEKAIAVNTIQPKTGLILHIANIIFLVTLPVLIIGSIGHEFSFVGSTVVCMLYLILFLKLWSYIQTNHWCRAGSRWSFAKNRMRRQSLSEPNWTDFIQEEVKQTEDESDPACPDPVQYPDNLNMRDLCYFLLAPTLCYELNFPRTTRIRKRFVMKRLLELVVGVNLMMALFQQWIVPSVRNSLVPFSDMDYVRIAERLLKLALPNHLMWFAFFYLNFHSLLNLAGELLHFADRSFYNDWWNANNIDTFWRTWNMPVHRWAVRHVYVPVTERGYGRTAASMLVFFISAFFHEYLVSVPLQTFKVWAFLGMMAQLPLSSVSRAGERWLGARGGNLVVWSSLILGQPLAIMMYYHDYAIKHLDK